jgi:hypothetical protein
MESQHLIPSKYTSLSSVAAIKETIWIGVESAMVEIHPSMHAESASVKMTASVATELLPQAWLTMLVVFAEEMILLAPDAMVFSSAD